jgi:hypothetical protein
MHRQKYRIPLTFLSLLISSIAFSQQTDARFSSVDSFVTTIKYKGELTALTRKRTEGFLKPGQAALRV